MTEEDEEGESRREPAVKDEEADFRQLQRRTPVQRSVLVVALLASCVSQIVVSFLIPFFPTVAMKTYGASEMDLGIILASLPFACVVSGPFVPAVIAHLGRELTLVVGLALMVGATFIFGFGASFTHFVVARTGQGLASSLISVASTALLMTHSPDLGADLGMIEAFNGVVYTVGPVVGGVLFTYLGFLATFASLSVLILLVMLCMPVLLRPLRRLKERHLLVSTSDDDNATSKDWQTCEACCGPGSE